MRIEGSKVRSTGKAKASVARSSKGGFVLDCPACGEHQFKRWPFGWDAQAAHRYTGLESVDAETRKAEFKSRFGYLFR